MNDSQQLRDILNAIPSAVVLIDVVKDRIAYVNRRAAELYGMNSEGLELTEHFKLLRILKPDGSLLPPEDLPLHITKKTGKAVSNTEILIETAKGRRFPALINTAPLLDESGNLSTVILIFDDISYQKQIERKLRDDQKLYLTILDHTHDGISLIDLATHKYLFMNNSQIRIAGLTEDEAKTIDFEQVCSRVYPDDRAAFARQFNDVLNGQEDDSELIYRWIHHHNDLRWFGKRSRLVRDETGKPYAILGINRDISATHFAEEALRKSEANYRLLAETMADVIWVMNTNTLKFTYISPSIVQLRGYSVEESMAQRIDESMTPESLKTVMADFQRTLPEFIADPSHPRQYINIIQQPCKNGEMIWVEVSSRYRYNDQGEIEIIASSRNINERKLKEEEILYASLHDPLTGLLNRKALRLLDCNSTGRLNQKSALFINIDNFRVINDALGHREGDQVLQELAEQIKTCVDDNGIAYHFGGDEFLVIVETTDPETVESLALELQKLIAKQMVISQQSFYLTASIGISFGRDQEEIEQTIKNADTALYVAKREKNRITVYNPLMDQTRTREALLEKDLKKALEMNEFELYYQPIHDAQNGQVRQAEALLRWQHPTLGRVSPVEFIPLAEKSKLIIPITEWIIEHVCAKIRQWKADGYQEMMIGINLSALSFENRGSELTLHIARTIQAAGIRPSTIKLEITESSLIRDTEEIIRAFNDLRKIGVHLVLDDFGTGYSSFGYLKDLPVNIVKLDRSLIGCLDQDEREQLIVESMIRIIHGLGIKVVAEGVETVEQLDFLKNYGCDYIQGFLYSKPLPETDFLGYLDSTH